MPLNASVRGSFGAQGVRGGSGSIPGLFFGNYYGNGSDGAAVISTDTQLVVPNKNGSYDGDYVVRQYTSLTINSGTTLTTDQPCKGLFIYVQGNCTINGTLSMRGRGAAANPDSFLGANGIRYAVRTSAGNSATLASSEFTGCGSSIISAVSNQPGGSGRRIIQIPKRGSNGGASVSGGITSNLVGNNGSAGSNSGTDTLVLSPGGGGSGGVYSDTNSCNSNSSGITSGRGGNATAFSGGTGGGGKMSGTGVTGGVPAQGNDNGGEGGEGGNGHCGGVHSTTGGVGNPGGWDQYGSSSQSGYNQTAHRANSGTGGVVWLIVGGTLTISGTVDVRGVDNTNYNSSRNAGGVYGAGGGSGGGTAILMYRQGYSLAGNVFTSGGSGYTVVDAGAGGTGGSGSVAVIQLANS
jgi:hypothetical protein